MDQSVGFLKVRCDFVLVRGRRRRTLTCKLLQQHVCVRVSNRGISVFGTPTEMHDTTLPFCLRICHMFLCWFLQGIYYPNPQNSLANGLFLNNAGWGPFCLGSLRPLFGLKQMDRFEAKTKITFLEVVPRLPCTEP